MLSKMSSVIKFEFHVAMKGIHKLGKITDWEIFRFKINWYLC